VTYSMHRFALWRRLLARAPKVDRVYPPYEARFERRLLDEPADDPKNSNASTVHASTQTGVDAHVLVLGANSASPACFSLLMPHRPRRDR
jgi:hypothetical protein